MYRPYLLKLLIIAYLIWKGSYNGYCVRENFKHIIAYLIWKGSYNFFELFPLSTNNYSISDLERKL